jgi:hypothetical protein
MLFLPRLLVTCMQGATKLSVLRGKLDAKGAVFPDNPDPQELQEGTENPADQEHLESPDSPADHQQSALKSLPLHADHALLDPQDPPDHKDPPAPLDDLDNLAGQEAMDDPEIPDLRDPPDPTESQAEMVSPENLVPLRSQHPTPPENQDDLETLEDKDFPETQEQMGNQEATETPDQKDPLDPPVPQANQAEMETQDKTVNQDPPERGVSAPNIVLWMVVFSSKMGQGDKMGHLFFPLINTKLNIFPAPNILPIMLLPFSLYRFLSPFTSFLYPYSSALP